MTRPAFSPSSATFGRTFGAMALAVGLSLGVASPALADEEPAADEPKTEQTKGEKRLARLLEGRVAGEPQDCIRVMPTERMTTIDKTAYVYGRGNTIYVQRTRKPAQIDDRDALVTRRFGGGSQLCRVDVTTTVDPLTGMLTGAVFFEDFVPYTRIKDDSEG